MARGAAKTLGRRNRLLAWHASEPAFSWRLATFYVLAHMPWFIYLWAILTFDTFSAGPYTDSVVAQEQMFFWMRVLGWLSLGWAVAMTVEAALPWQQRVPHRLPVMLFGVLIAGILLYVSYQASVNYATDPRSSSFEFQYDPIKMRWDHQPHD